MRSIYKYSVPMENLGRVRMPEGATPISVGVQYEQIFVWCAVDTNNPQVWHYFRVFGTGHELPSDFDEHALIGTVMGAGGMFVWHIFDAGEIEPDGE